MGRKKTYNQLTTEQFQEKVHKFYPNIDIISEYINVIFVELLVFVKMLIV